MPSVPENPVGRCARCGLTLSVVQSASGLWRTIDHFGCLGSLVPASECAPEEPAPEWKVDSLVEAQFVINVLLRRSIQDIEHINNLYDRVSALEAPWYTRMWRKLRDR